MKVFNGKIICVGRNYIEHIHELKNEIPQAPVIFIKNSSCAASHITLPSKRIHYEVEITFLFGDKAQIVGVGVGLDLTDRALQTYLKEKGLPWELAKSFDNSAVLSDFVAIDNQAIKDLSFKAYKNNQLVQEGGYPLMIYKPYDIVTFLRKNNISVAKNDVLMSGTPKGVGDIEKGDIFTISLFLGDTIILEETFRA